MLLALQLNNLLEEGAPAVPVLVGSIPNISATLDTGTHQFNLGQYFTGATSYGIAPAVETGWSFNTGTAALQIDTDVEDVFGPYTVTATNAEGSTPSNAFTVNVSDFIAAGYKGGTAVDATGVMGTEFLNDVTAAPSTKIMLGGIAHTQAGLRYVALWPSSNQVFYNDGIARRSDGAMVIVTSGTPRDFVNGIGLSYRGEVIVSTSAPEVIHMGYGITQAGALCVSEAS